MLPIKTLRLWFLCFLILTFSTQAGISGNNLRSNTFTGKKPLLNQNPRPLPRFVSLRSSEVYLRTGPGVRYPVDWVYKSKFLPVEIIQEFKTWRKIRDMQGTQGWVHQSMLSNRRMFVIIGQPKIIRRSDNRESSAIAKLETYVIGKIEK